MNVTAMYAEIGRLLGDPNNDRWVVATLLARINLAQTRVLGLTNAVKTKEALTPVAGTATVSLDTDTMDIIRVHIKNSSGSWKKLDGILRDQLDFQSPGWRQFSTGEPLAYTWDGTNLQLTLIPAPSSEWAQTNGLEVWEVQKPADMATGADTVFAANNAMIPYHMSVVHWVVAQCWMDDGTPEALGKSKFHSSGDFARPGEFENEIKQIWKKFDSPEDIPARILWRPQGGRASRAGLYTKSNPI